RRTGPPLGNPSGQKHARRSETQQSSPQRTRAIAAARSYCRWCAASPWDGNVTTGRRSSSERIFMPWLWLIVGGVFEVGFTTSLRFVDGFRNLPWTLTFLASVAVSMGLLEVASRSIPMGTAYAVWGGIGAVGTVAVGIL